MDRARVTLKEFYDQDLTPEQRAAAELVVDHEAEQTRCPACLSEFAPADLGPPGSERCPDCGLNLGA